MNEIILGIDLGTTNSVGSYWANNKINYIKNNDNFIFPSNIKFTGNGKIVCQNNNYENIKILNC